MTAAAKAAAVPPIVARDGTLQGGTFVSADSKSQLGAPENSYGRDDPITGADAVGIDNMSSVSKGDGVVADDSLPVGHTVFVSLMIPRGSKVVQVDDTAGIKLGMRFMMGIYLTTEIGKVLRLGVSSTMRRHYAHSPSRNSDGALG